MTCIEQFDARTEQSKADHRGKVPGLFQWAHRAVYISQAINEITSQAITKLPVRPSGRTAEQAIVRLWSGHRTNLSNIAVGRT